MFGLSINVFDFLTYENGRYIDGGMGKIKQLVDFNGVQYQKGGVHFGYYMDIMVSKKMWS